jgi:hypothetical protein
VFSTKRKRLPVQTTSVSAMPASTYGRTCRGVCALEPEPEATSWKTATATTGAANLDVSRDSGG